MSKDINNHRSKSMQLLSICLPTVSSRCSFLLLTTSWLHPTYLPCMIDVCIWLTYENSPSILGFHSFCSNNSSRSLPTSRSDCFILESRSGRVFSYRFKTIFSYCFETISSYLFKTIFSYRFRSILSNSSKEGYLN